MRAAVLVDVGRIELRDIPVVPPGPHDVLLRVTAVGLCGTDFHIFGGHANYHTDHRGRPSRSRSTRRCSATRSSASWTSAAAACRPGARRPRRRRPGNQLPQRAPADLRVLRVGRLAPVRGLSRARHHRPAGRARRAHHGARREHDRRRPALPSAHAGAHRAARLHRALVRHVSTRARRATASATRTPNRRVRTVLVSGAGPAGLLFIQYLRAGARVGRADPRVASRTRSSGGLPRRSARSRSIRLGRSDRGGAATTAGRRVEYLIDASGAGELFRQIPGVLRKQGTVLLYGHGHAGVDLSVLNNVQFLEPTLRLAGRRVRRLRARRPAGDVPSRARADRERARRCRPDRHAPLHVARRCARGVRRRAQAPDYVKGVVELQPE